MKKAVIFDLDGTLLDTAMDIGLAVNTTLGTDFSPVQIKTFVGNGLRNAIKAAIAACGRTDCNLDEYFEILKANYRKVPVRYTKPFDGIPQMLACLSGMGIVTGVFSNKEQDLAETVIRTTLPDCNIPFIVGRNGLYKAKPDPEAVFAFCDFAGCSVNDLLYVGDSEVDWACSRAVGCDAVIFTWGSRTPQQLIASGVPESVFSADAMDIVAKASAAV